MLFKKTLRKIAALVLETEISLTIVYVFVCLSFLCFSIHFVRTLLRNYDGDGDGNGNVKKVIGLMSKTTTLHVHHAFFVHFFAVRIITT